MVPFGANLRKYLALKERDGGNVADDGQVAKGFGRFGKRPAPAVTPGQRPPAQVSQPGAPSPMPKQTASVAVSPHPPVIATPPAQPEDNAQVAPGQPPPQPPALPPTPTAAEQPLDPTQDQQAQVSPQAQAAMRSVARILAPHRGELTTSDLAGLCEAIGIPDDTWHDDEEEPGNEYVAMSADYPQDMTMTGTTIDARTEASALTGKISEGLDTGKKDKEVAAMDAETIRKEYDDKLRLLEERNERVEKQLQIERDDRERREYIAKAAEFPRIGSESQRITILKALRKADDKGAVDAFDAVMKATEAQLKDQDESRTGIMKEFGSRGGDPSNSDDPRAKLNALADAIVEKDSGMTREKALVERIYKTKEGRELVHKEREQMADRRRAING